jgi:hypothetical protein
MQDSLGSLEQRDHFEDLRVGGRIILKWILNYCMFYLVRCFSFINMKEQTFCLYVLLRLKLILKEESGRTWTGLIWLRLRTSSGLLWILMKL